MVEAQIIESVLKERDILHRIRSFHDTAYDGLYQLQKRVGGAFGVDCHQYIDI